MSYASQSSVAVWTQNLLNQPGGLFTQAAAVCDAMIDAELGNFFRWPYDSSDQAINAPPPAYVQQMANLLTAAIIENIAYSQMQGKTDLALDSTGGIGGSTYGRMLYSMFRQQMKMLVKGLAYVNSLQRYSSIGMQKACRPFRLQVGLASDSEWGIPLLGGAIDQPGSNDNAPEEEV